MSKEEEAKQDFVSLKGSNDDRRHPIWFAIEIILLVLLISTVIWARVTGSYSNNYLIVNVDGNTVAVIKGTQHDLNNAVESIKSQNAKTNTFGGNGTWKIQTPIN